MPLVGGFLAGTNTNGFFMSVEFSQGGIQCAGIVVADIPIDRFSGIRIGLQRDCQILNDSLVQRCAEGSRIGARKLSISGDKAHCQITDVISDYDSDNYGRDSNVQDFFV